ncbi:MAG: ABC transporter substrate-binding protein, partial [Saprospiraceae bacterium]|nr:ABC transporter substrate-binding protein [Saprospiraceae bacterium]
MATNKNIFFVKGQRSGSYWLLCLVIFTIACRSSSNQNKMVFAYNQIEGLATLDPAFAKNQATMWVAHQLYNTLVEVDSNLNIVPSLAKGWNVSADRLTYTFYLRNDVYFHDNPLFANGKGRRLIAADVVYSLNRIRDPQTASSGAWIFNNRVDAVGGFTAVDDTTFTVKLLRPFQPILGILSMQYCSIVAHEAVEKYGKDFRSHPLGSGPFNFHFWEEGQALILHKNQHYWENDTAGQQLPYLDAIKISFLDSRATEFLSFQQGELSFINDIDPSFKDEVLTKTGTLRPDWQGKIILKKHPYLNTEYLGILV